ncbi:hypothetical protein [Pseudomonas oryziphila]|uniref:Immunity protein 42 n=1 Tax=Pseudomonas oryziphila TaxID=2894079 RepID=A0ABN5TLA7_9PSED|nr:hypothetical protein [Pseudomonas oryziphila]AZL75660.1 hypothetical protein EI693_22260 [Pseudomonas oryziphila]
MKKNNAFSLDSDIVPGRSIGGVSLGDCAEEVFYCIADTFDVRIFEFENFGIRFVHYEVNGGVVSFVAKDDGKISSLWCKPPYSGNFDGRLFPGITAGELKSVSKRQELVSGYLVVDRNYLIYYGMSDNIDDFNHFSDLDDNVVFEELHVGGLR